MDRPGPVTLLPAFAGAAWCAPALAPLSPAVCGALGLHRAAADGVHLTFDDVPHPEGTPAVLDVPGPAPGRAGDVLPRRGAGPPRPGAGPGRWPTPGHVVALHGDRHRCLLRVSPRALARRPRPRPRDDRRRGRAAPRRSTGRRTASPARPDWPSARRRGWATWLWSRWGRDWRADATPASVARLAGEGLRAATSSSPLHDADHYSARGCWRSTVGALPRILEAAATAGLQPRALPAG